MKRVLAVAVLALVFAAPAHAGTPPVVAQVASWSAGKPVTVACDADKNNFGLPAEMWVEGYTYLNADVIHVDPLICLALEEGPNLHYWGADHGQHLTTFGESLAIVLHEAQHAKGVGPEKDAERFADLAVYQALRKFYRVPFFSHLSKVLGKQASDATRTRPKSYWWWTA